LPSNLENLSVSPLKSSEGGILSSASLAAWNSSPKYVHDYKFVS
jgi:hypothetical protein